MKLGTMAIMTGAWVGGASAALADVAALPPQWEPTTWCGEPAYAATSAGWRAIVSVERGRLVAFGPAADAGPNLLHSPATRTDPAGWGGHRVWLGPQDTWPGGWPPAKAWEYSAPARIEADGARLMLELPPSGTDWPDVRREYEWDGDALHCRVTARGGRRPAQIIQIIQVVPDAVVSARVKADERAPRGYVQLHLGRHPSPQPAFARPAHVTELRDGALELRFINRTEKLGFAAQTLSARIGDIALDVSGGATSGRTRSTPDDGYVTQVYLGSGENQLIELEQLSPLFEPGAEARFEMVLRARRAP